MKCLSIWMISSGCCGSFAWELCDGDRFSTVGDFGRISFPGKRWSKWSKWSKFKFSKLCRSLTARLGITSRLCLAANFCRSGCSTVIARTRWEERKTIATLGFQCLGRKASCSHSSTVASGFWAKSRGRRSENPPISKFSYCVRIATTRKTREIHKDHQRSAAPEISGPVCCSGNCCLARFFKDILFKSFKTLFNQFEYFESVWMQTCQFPTELNDVWRSGRSTYNYIKSFILGPCEGLSIFGQQKVFHRSARVSLMVWGGLGACLPGQPALTGKT